MSRELRGLPKTQLHLHLAGAMRPAALRELAEGYGVPVPSNDGRKLKAWAQFQGLYDAARAVIRTPDDIARVLRQRPTTPPTGAAGWRSRSTRPRTRR